MGAKAEQGSDMGCGSKYIPLNGHIPYISWLLCALEFLLCPQRSSGGRTAAISIWVCAFVAHPPWCGRQSPFYLEVQGQKSGDDVRAFCMREVCLFHMTSIPGKRAIK